MIFFSASHFMSLFYHINLLELGILFTVCWLSITTES